MDSTIMVALISAVGTIIIALINKNTNKKVTKSNELKNELLQEIKQNREEYKQEISNHILENDKTYLTDFLSDIESGEPKKEIQIRRAYEIKKEYNEKGGDSYIDDKWEELVKKGILKERRVNLYE